MKVIAALALLAWQAGAADAVSRRLTVPDGIQGDVEVAVVCRHDTGWDRLRWARLAGDRVMAQRWRQCRVLLREPAAALYVASRQLTWNAGAEPVALVQRFRVVRAPAVGGASWLSASPFTEAECTSFSDIVECLFVGLGEAGVIVSEVGGQVRAALVPRDAHVAIWGAASWGRFVRVGSPAGTRVDASVQVLIPALKQGRGLLRDWQPAPGVTVHRITDSSFWLSGDSPDGGAELRLQAPGAARLGRAIASIRGDPATAIDIQLSVERVISGRIDTPRHRAQPTTVMLSRMLAPERRGGAEVRPMERIAEIETDDAGRFRFEQLGDDEYEVMAIHASLGRVRKVVRPPVDLALSLASRTVRGRVTLHGVPRPGVTVLVLPMLEDVVAVENPLMLAADAIVTGADGRFEIALPAEGRAVLSARLDEAVARLDLGDVGNVSKLLDVGDVPLPSARDVDVMVALPAGCRLRAAGPMGQSGVMIVNAEPHGVDRWRIRIPVDGRWLMAGVCSGRELALVPPMVEIGPRTRIVELRIRQ